MIIFDVPLWQVLSLLAGTVLPLLVGLVTTRATNPGTKAIALAGLSVATNLVTELADALQGGDRYNLGMALLLALGTFLVAVGTHYGLWKPTSPIGRRTPSGPPTRSPASWPQVTIRSSTGHRGRTTAPDSTEHGGLIG